MFDIVNESPDKDGFSTACRSYNHASKRMDPRHEMIGIVFIGNVKCVRIVGFQNMISEYCGGGSVYPSVSGSGGGGDGGYASLLCGYGRVVPCLFLLCLNIASLLENSISHSGHVEDIS